MLACTQTPESDETGCAFNGPAPVDGSLDLPWRSLSAKSPLPCLDPFRSAGTGPRPSKMRVEVPNTPSEFPRTHRTAVQPAHQQYVSTEDQTLLVEKDLEEHSTAPGLKVREMNKRAQQNFRQRQEVTQLALQA